MLLLTLFLVGTTASTYDLIGYGWCRSQAGQDEKVNGYYRFKLENDACRSQCDVDPNCFGYASESISGSPGYCYIHVPESTPIPAMWLAFTKSNYDIAASSGDTEVKCFIKSGVDFGCGLGNPADAGCGCGQPADAGCGCGQPGPSGCDNQCGSTLEDEGCGCGIICEAETKQPIWVLYSRECPINPWTSDGFTMSGALSLEQCKQRCNDGTWLDCKGFWLYASIENSGGGVCFWTAEESLLASRTLNDNCDKSVWLKSSTITISSGNTDIELTIAVVGDEHAKLDINDGKFPGEWRILSEGSEQFSDRKYVLTHVPDYLLGAKYFRGPCHISGGASLTIKTSGTVYLLASHGNTNDELGKLTFDPEPQSRESIQMDTNSFRDVRGFEQWTWATTTSPTEMPSKEPSEMPSEKPSEMPSETPSEMPSKEPSMSPTKEPSMTPTYEPSMLPTEKPTPGLCNDDIRSKLGFTCKRFFGDRKVNNDICMWCANQIDDANFMEDTAYDCKYNADDTYTIASVFSNCAEVCSEDIRSEFDSLSFSDGMDTFMMNQALKMGVLNKNCFYVNQIDGTTFMKDTAYDCKYNAFDTYTIASIFSNCAEAAKSCSYWNCGCKGQNENVEFIYGTSVGIDEGCRNSFENGGSRCYMKDIGNDQTSCVELPTTCADYEGDYRSCKDVDEGCYWNMNDECKKTPETCADAQDKVGCSKFFSDICTWNDDTNTCYDKPLTCAEGNEYTCEEITNEECYIYDQDDMLSCRKKPETCSEAQDVYGCKSITNEECYIYGEDDMSFCRKKPETCSEAQDELGCFMLEDICKWNDDTNSCDIIPLTCAEGNKYTCKSITNEECYVHNEDDMSFCRKKPETCSEAKDSTGCYIDAFFEKGTGWIHNCHWRSDTNTCIDFPTTCEAGGSRHEDCEQIIKDEDCYRYTDDSEEEEDTFCRKKPETCAEAEDKKGCGFLKDVCKWNHDTENCDLLPLTCAEGNESTCSEITNEVCMWNSENSSCSGMAEASAHYYVEWEKQGTCYQYSYAALSVCEKMISQFLSFADDVQPGTCPNSYVINHQKSLQQGDCNVIFTDFSMAETTHEPTVHPISVNHLEGYEFYGQGDCGVHGNGDEPGEIMSVNIPSIQHCAKLCSDHETCIAFEFETTLKRYCELYDSSKGPIDSIQQNNENYECYVRIPEEPSETVEPSVGSVYATAQAVLDSQVLDFAIKGLAAIGVVSTLIWAYRHCFAGKHTYKELETAVEEI